MAEITWTPEQAVAAQEAAAAANPKLIRGPLCEWQTLHELLELESQFRAGDKGALLHAIYKCSLDGLPLPEWVATAYGRAYRRILACEAKSLDEAFGSPFPKGHHVAAARRRRELRPAIYLRIKAMLDGESPPPVDDELFEQVGAEFNVGKTVCAKLYYQGRNLFAPAYRPRLPRNS
jgi:hypothetical protein